ncbi:HipA N-terminal domain-containing protein [Corynebacterium cystitidis]|uniref:HipA N-terminal domain-containing protein n=1 Tax=Corynebacterium cystitidis TaxID=35757 RepID=UPI00358DC08E
MPPTRFLEAHDDGHPIGRFEEHNGQITFRYSENATFPISPSMPLSASEHKNRAAYPFLWGLLPDNQEALSAMAQEASTSPNSVLAS